MTFAVRLVRVLLNAKRWPRWGKMSTVLGSRTGSAVRQRLNNRRNMQAERRLWTGAEDGLLILVEFATVEAAVGQNIARLIAGRTRNLI